jgi:hypothetical protein
MNAVSEAQGLHAICQRQDGARREPPALIMQTV